MKTKVALFIFFLIALNGNSQTQLIGITHFGGTPFGGGVYDQGTIFISDSSGATIQTLFNFNSNIEKAPFGSLCLSDNGSLYGITGLNAFHHNCICYRYNPITANITSINDFLINSTMGWDARSGMIKLNDGRLFGLCAHGGSYLQGVIYSIDTNDVYSDVYDFDGTNGANAYGSFTQLNNGKLYGIGTGGGANNLGVIFSFDPINNVYTKLYDFNFTIGGDTYYGSLTRATNGKFYGLTQYGGANNYGEIFSFDETTGTYIDLYDFDYLNGANPRSNLIQASNGNFYGMTYSGGIDSVGVLFCIDTNSNFTKLLDFNGNNGAYPTRRLLQSTSGKLFGTTSYGGINNVGVAFRYDIITNTYTKLTDFNDSINGSNPDGEIIEVPTFGIAGINYLSLENELNLFPNPSNNNITIQLTAQPTKAILKIYNVLGEMVFTTSTTTLLSQIDVSNFSTGLYFLSVQYGNKSINGKFVKE